MRKTRWGHLEALEPRHLLTGTPQMVVDTVTAPALDVSDAFGLGETLYFYASEKHTGRELWQTDGTSVGTRSLGDFAPGPSDSSANVWADFDSHRIVFWDGGLWSIGEGDAPQRLSVPADVRFGVGGDQLFFGTDGELWVTDGTQDGTRAIFSGDRTHRVVEVVPSAGGALFRTSQLELWYTDGTARGTEQLFAEFRSDFFDGPGPDRSTIHATQNGWVFLGGAFQPPVAVGFAGQRLLWFSDGQQANTRPLLRVANVAILGEDSSHLLLQHDGREYWITDGTQEGTQPVLATLDATYVGPTANGFLFANRWAEETALWRIAPDGSETRVATLANQSTRPSPIASLPGQRVLFRTRSAGVTTVWISDGTPEATHPLPLSSDGRFQVTTAGPSRFVVEVTNGEVRETWISSGAPADTWLATADGPRTASAAFGNRPLRASVAHDGSLYFTEPVTGGDVHLWRLPTGDRTLQAVHSAQGYSEFQVTPHGLSFLAITTGSGPGPSLAAWNITGPEEAPQVLRALEVPSGDAAITNIVALGGQVFFVQRSEIWRSDGTPEGTTKVVLPEGRTLKRVTNLVAHGEHVYFFDWSLSEADLWRTDGTVGGTQLLEASVSFPIDLVSLQGELYLTTLVPQQLWRLVTSESGQLVREQVLDTRSTPVPLGERDLLIPDRNLILDSVTHQARPFPVASPLTQARAVDDRIVFHADDKVWVSDGTQAGTLDLIEGEADLIAVGNEALYLVIDEQIFASDGTRSGTLPLPLELPLEGTIKDIQVVDDTLLIFHRSYRPNQDRIFSLRGGRLLELATVDHTWHRAGDDSQFFFSTRDALWRTDGTPEGTRQIEGIFPTDHSHPNDLAFASGALFLVAEDGLHGDELWKVPLTRTYDPADISPDGEIDLADFLILAENFGRSVFPTEGGDIDGNGLVDFTDFLHLSAAFA